MDKFKDINADKMLSFSDIICLSETWLPDDECKSHLHISGYELHLNSCGKGKGLAIYYKTGKFEAKTTFKDPTLQISQLLSTDLNVIVCYRSKADQVAKTVVPSLITTEKATVVLGDFNVESN